MAHLAVGEGLAPVQIVDAVHLRDESPDPLQAVSDLRAHRIQIQAAGLLKIGELGDLQSIQKHLPSDSPCSKSRGFPIVLFETEVVLSQVNPQGTQALEINVLHVSR